MKRGEIWWADFGAPLGSEPGYRRPVLIVQSNVFNRSRISTVIIAAISSNLALESAPGNVRLSRSDSKLAKASVVNVSQISSADRARLVGKVSTLAPSQMSKVEAGLKLVMGFDG